MQYKWHFTYICQNFSDKDYGYDLYVIVILGTDVQVKQGYLDYSVHALSQWETALLCNVVSHWLGAYTIWSLRTLLYHENGHCHDQCLWHRLRQLIFPEGCDSGLITLISDIKILPGKICSVREKLNFNRQNVEINYMMIRLNCWPGKIYNIREKLNFAG